MSSSFLRSRRLPLRRGSSLPIVVAGALALALSLVPVCGTAFDLLPSDAGAGVPVAHAEVRKSDVILGSSVDSRGLSVAQSPSIEAKYAICMGSDGTVYYERDADSPSQIASVTKVMTGLVALKAVDDGIVSLDTPVEVSAEAASVGESSAGLLYGDVMPLQTALAALLVPSGNDAAVAIAQTVGQAMIDAGTASSADPEQAFVDAMNEEASALGCADTVYENPHGLDDDGFEGNLHSTARDVALVVREAMGYQQFRDAVALGDTDITVSRAGSDATIHLVATDEFPQYTEYAVGVKTGFTSLAGACFAGATNKDGLELYSIVLGCEDESTRFQDAATLAEWVYDHLVTYPLANSPDRVAMDGAQVPVVAEVACLDWIDKTVPATMEDPSATVELFDLNGNISQTVEFYEPTGEVRTGDVVGHITFTQRNTIVASQDLVACESVAAPGIFERVGIFFDRLVRNFTGAEQHARSVVLNTTTLIVDKTAS